MSEKSPKKTKLLKDFLLTGKNNAPCPWTILDVAVFTALILIFVFHDPFYLGMHVLRFLRMHFFIFTKEPKLFYYLTLHINTIIMKTVSIVLLAILIKSRSVSFRDKVVSPGKMPHNLVSFWMPLYMSVCFVIVLINRTNPLIPNIPFNSAFAEAKVIGNIVIVFSVLFVAPVVEEILFRGFFYPAFNKKMGIYPAIFLTSLLFTAAHYSQLKGEYMIMVSIFVLSVMITYAKAKTGSTVLAILMHHIYNLISVATGFVDYAIFKY